MCTQVLAQAFADMLKAGKHDEDGKQYCFFFGSQS